MASKCSESDLCTVSWVAADEIIPTIVAKGLLEVCESSFEASSLQSFHETMTLLLNLEWLSTSTRPGDKIV
jgi:hypothetical protein